MKTFSEQHREKMVEHLPQMPTTQIKFCLSNCEQRLMGALLGDLDLTAYDIESTNDWIDRYRAELARREQQKD